MSRAKKWRRGPAAGPQAKNDAASNADGSGATQSMFQATPAASQSIPRSRTEGGSLSSRMEIDNNHSHSANAGQHNNGDYRRSGTRARGFGSPSRRDRSARRDPSQARAVRKRKFDDDYRSDRQSQKRMRTSNGETVMDEAYIRSILPYPTPEDYPTAPPTLFNNLLVSALHNIGNNALKLRPNVSTEGTGFKCDVSGILPDGSPMSAVGMSANKVCPSL